jgi:hypothetical protein
MTATKPSSSLSPITPMASQKAVLVLASSGGGTATLGHTDPSALLHTIHAELKSINAFIKHALYVALCDGSGLDLADASRTQVVLWEAKFGDDSGTFANTTSPSQSASSSQHASDIQQLTTQAALCDTLENVNAYISNQRYDEQLAEQIQQGDIHAILCISCSPSLFPLTLSVAARTSIPVTGSGGTSLSQAASLYQVRLVGSAGGSVATTSATRAISYTSSLAQDWKRPYSYQQHMATRRGKLSETTAPTTTSVLSSCLGVAWAICLMKNLVIPWLKRGVWLSFHYDISSNLQPLCYMLERWCLPVTCSIIMATSSSSTAVVNNNNPPPTIIMAAVLAIASSEQSLLGGLLAGKLVALLSERIMFHCITHNVPATMTNLLTSGGLGAVIALFLMPVMPLFRATTTFMRQYILWSVQQADHRLNMVSAFGWGLLSCHGSRVGWYHAVHLPLIMVEMEQGHASFLGAIDELTLVLVCAGVCLGKLMVRAFQPEQISDADGALCWRGIRINLLYGDFVEACYPFAEASGLINVACYMASGLSCASLFMPLPFDSYGHLHVTTSMAYLPWPAAVALSGHGWLRFLLASAIALVIPMGATITFHSLQSLRAGPKDD